MKLTLVATTDIPAGNNPASIPVNDNHTNGVVVSIIWGGAPSGTMGSFVITPPSAYSIDGTHNIAASVAEAFASKILGTVDGGFTASATNVRTISSLTCTFYQ